MHRYKFKQVSILSLAYAVTFGTELAVVSMLPLFFLETFDIPVVTAGSTGRLFCRYGYNFLSEWRLAQ